MNIELDTDDIAALVQGIDTAITYRAKLARNLAAMAAEADHLAHQRGRTGSPIGDMYRRDAFVHGELSAKLARLRTFFAQAQAIEQVNIVPVPVRDIEVRP